MGIQISPSSTSAFYDVKSDGILMEKHKYHRKHNNFSDNMSTKPYESRGLTATRAGQELRRMFLERRLGTPEFKALADKINFNGIIGNVKPVIFEEYYRLYKEGKFAEASSMLDYFIPSKNKGIISAKMDADKSNAAKELKRTI